MGLIIVVGLRIHILAGDGLKPAGGHPAFFLCVIVFVYGRGGGGAGIVIPFKVGCAVFIKSVFPAVDFLGVVVRGLFAVGGKIKPVSIPFPVVVLVIYSCDIFPSRGHAAVSVIAAIIHAALPGIVIRQHFAALVNPSVEHASFVVKGKLCLSGGGGKGNELHIVTASGFLYSLAVGLEIVPPLIRLV